MDQSNLPISREVNSNIIYVNDAKLTNTESLNTESLNTESLNTQLSNPQYVYISYPRRIRKKSFVITLCQFMTLLSFLSIFFIILVILIRPSDYDDDLNTNSTQYN